MVRLTDVATASNDDHHLCDEIIGSLSFSQIAKDDLLIEPLDWFFRRCEGAEELTTILRHSDPKTRRLVLDEGIPEVRPIVLAPTTSVGEVLLKEREGLLDLEGGVHLV